jgi:hypothetical protein
MNIRKSRGGSIRDRDNDKLDYEGCLSPIILESFAKYMKEHEICSDGSKRVSDNWQLGMEKSWYMKSLLRHVISTWKLHRGFKSHAERIGGKIRNINIEDSLNGVIFNAMGYLFEILKERNNNEKN